MVVGPCSQSSPGSQPGPFFPTTVFFPLLFITCPWGWQGLWGQKHLVVWFSPAVPSPPSLYHTSLFGRDLQRWQASSNPAAQGWKGLTA